MPLAAVDVVQCHRQVHSVFMVALTLVFSFSVAVATFGRLFNRSLKFRTTVLTLFVFLTFSAWVLEPDLDYWIRINCALSGYTFCPATLADISNSEIRMR